MLLRRSDGLASLLEDVEQVYMHELDVVSDVFPDPVPVVNQLLQRIFAETVRNPRIMSHVVACLSFGLLC